MTQLIIIILLATLLLGILAAFVQVWQDRRRRKKLQQGLLTPEEVEQAEAVNPADAECCGQHAVCEKDSLLAAMSREVEYYNDEELDRFRGRESDQYGEEECEEFREILYTMRSDEVAGWVRSLQLREVNLPDEVKDEVFLIVGERRQPQYAPQKQ